MKTSHQSMLNDILNSLLWILMTIFSIIKSAITFITNLFFYKNISIESEIRDDYQNFKSKEDLTQQNTTFNEDDNTNLNSEEFLHNYNQYNINSAKDKDQSYTENTTYLEEESQIDEEDEREKIKILLEKEDERDLQKDDENQNNTSLNSLKNPEKEPPPKSSHEKDTTYQSEESDTDIDDEAETKESVNEPNEKRDKSKHISQKKINQDDETDFNDTEKESRERKNSLAHRSERNTKINQTDDDEMNKFSPQLIEKRKRYINEYIISQQEYCQYLNVLLDVYRAKLNAIIDKETSDLLFGSIRPLIVLSKQNTEIFNTELEKGPDNAEIWKCFTDIPKAVEIYVPYLSHYEKSLSTFKKLQSSNILFKLIVKKIESSNPLHKFTSIYEKPLQQLARVPNQLSNILKATPEWHPDYQKLPKIILALKDSFQYTERRWKVNENNTKLQELEFQITDCPPLVSPDRSYLGSFKLIDWKKLYILNDMLLIVRGKRLRKIVKMSNIKFVWLDSNTGTVHISTLNKKDIRIRGGIKGNMIYSVLKNQLNQKTSGLPPKLPEKHQTHFYRRSDLVRAPNPTSTLYSSMDESEANDSDSNSFTAPLFSNNSTNSATSTSTANNNNSSTPSTFMDSKDNNLMDDDIDDTDDDDDSDDTDDFGNIPEITGNIENSDSNEENTKTSTSSDNSIKFTDEMINNRKAAIENLQGSELQYQQKLHNLINLYRPRFTKSIENEKIEQVVFGNLSSLIIISEQYTKAIGDELKKGAEKAEIWKCFTINTMKFYQDYQQNYTNMLFHYNNFVLSEKKIRKFVKKIEAENPENLFTSLSKAPFIRIPLLIKQLQDICKVTPDWHPDSEHLPNTIIEFSQVSNDSNKKCTEAENLQKLIQIETSVIDCPSLFSSSRYLIKSFTLDDKASIYVLNDMIVFARTTKKFKYCVDFSDIKKISNKIKSVVITTNDGKTHSIKSNDQTHEIYNLLKQQKSNQVVSV